MAPVFEMFNHAEDNNAFFDFDKINKKLYVAAIKDQDSSDQDTISIFGPIEEALVFGDGPLNPD